MGGVGGVTMHNCTFSLVEALAFEHVANFLD